MFALLTEEERTFLRSILNNPAELTNWLVYADWLAERSDPRADLRAEFIRLEVRRAQLPDADPARLTLRARLEELRPGLDPNWVAVFDRPPIENCPSAFNFRCPRRWELLRGTDQPCVRHCGVCDKSVHFCHDLETAREHVHLGDCVAISTGLRRSGTDLMDPAEAEAWGCLLDDPGFSWREDVPN